MDARGWISISLLASFNRVKTLTYDLHLVRDVLTLSSLVEVKSDWVRTHRWKNYVLPDAPPSPLDVEGALPSTFYPSHVNVEETIPPSFGNPAGAQSGYSVDLPEGSAHYQDAQIGAHAYHHHGVVDREREEVEFDGEDEDEDDVEFVLGSDADHSWTQERKIEL